MRLLGLKDQQDIVRVIEHLVETHRKSNTVADVMQRFHLTLDEYRMCCNLAMPALAQGNMKGRFTAVSATCKAMRRNIKALYESVKDEEGTAADGVRLLYETYCTHHGNVVYGTAEDTTCDKEMDGDEEEEADW